MINIQHRKTCKRLEQVNSNKSWFKTVLPLFNGEIYILLPLNLALLQAMLLEHHYVFLSIINNTTAHHASTYLPW